MAEEKKNRSEELESLDKKINEIINGWNQNPEEIVEFLQFSSKFSYAYSPRNMMLIAQQQRVALLCKSFKAWKELGYSVKKGERKSHLSGHYKDWKKSDPNNFHPDKSMRKMFDLFREHSTVLDQKIVKAFPELATKLLPQELEVNSEKKKVVNKTAKRKPKKKKTPRL